MVKQKKRSTQQNKRSRPLRQSVSGNGRPAGHRIEHDSMGPVRVPAGAYYGAQTQRAVENFPISGLRVPRAFIQALGLVKWAAAQINEELGLLEPSLAKPIRQAAREVADGTFDDQFVVDIFQTGSGTSTNMNANEVIANRAAELSGGKIGQKSVHPNDHVNKSQSSNDVIPTVIHMAALELIDERLLPALRGLHKALAAKAKQFDRVVKIGRTHLQDATPIRLGQEFSGYARQIELAVQRVERCRPSLLELALGGTAVGTGINMPPQFAGRVIALLGRETGRPFTEAANHFEAQGAKDAIVEASGALKVAAVSLMKIANDVRWLGSGPRCGLGELLLPDTQPGSSIMPGKVNPVIAESVCQAAAQVIGYDAAIAVCGMSGNFELNVMMPVMAYDLLQSIHLLAASADNFTRRCIQGLKADEARCRAMIEQSLAMCTALAPVIGYDAAAAIAKEAYRTGKSVREIARARKVLPPDRLEQLLDPWRMTQPGSS
ncbi:MAG: class II fumarate hydratase [Nitrospirota bacterium]